MDKIAKQFGDVVVERLKALETNAFALEQAAGLPQDAIRNAIRSEKRAGPTLSRVEEICDALGLELYIGPKRADAEPQSLSPDDQDFALVPLYAATLAAGDGASNDGSETVGQFAFRREWLHSIGVAPSAAVLARVRGDSMSPAIQDGDMVLIDRSKADVPVRRRGQNDTRPAPIYALVDDGHARLKRIERTSEDLAVLVSDNPGFPPEVMDGARIRSLHVIGRVIWWGRTALD